MKLSFIIGTRNRAYALAACLDSIVSALAVAKLHDGEIVVVDNGSTDTTSDIIATWARKSPIAVQHLVEPQPGVSRAHNRALLSARGELLAFTDDDCRLSRDYVNDLLRHAAGDTELVLRGGRIELGNPTDLPLTIRTEDEPMRWNRAINSARRQPISGQINGCNMTMRRALVDKIGPFDERLGPGAMMVAGGDSDYLFRTYLAGFTLEYVPDMTVVHCHGRKTAAEGRKLLRGYLMSNGAEFVKHGWKDPNLCRPFLWDLKNAAKEIRSGFRSTAWLPYFSYRDKVVYAVLGALRYFFVVSRHGTRTLWDEQREAHELSSPRRDDE